ncbi:transcriptional regulator, LacI family [Pseudacidovorax sp. RU35E]|nr:transcriptional regulator, LacI family [Pseudacidovorax sp. RU35E]
MSNLPSRRSRRGTGAVTLHDVALLAGVAPITASRALNTPSQVSAEVLRRVQDAVASSGYVPNRLAGALASSRSRLVAAVVPTISGPVFQNTVHALNEALAAADYQLMLGQSGYEENREDALLDAIISRRPDGIVLTGIMHSDQGRQKLLAAGIPVVETWDLTSSPIDMIVGFSHADAGSEVAAFLHARGRRRLGLVAGHDERARRRTQAFVDTAKALGMPEPHQVVVTAPTTMRSGRTALRQMLECETALDAVFCSSDLLALGVLAEAHAQGLKVPDDLALVGFGDQEFAADAYPALTSVHIKGAAIGTQAARFILDRVQGQAIDQRVVDIGFSIVERETT